MKQIVQIEHIETRNNITISKFSLLQKILKKMERLILIWICLAYIKVSLGLDNTSDGNSTLKDATELTCVGKFCIDSNYSRFVPPSENVDIGLYIGIQQVL